MFQNHHQFWYLSMKKSPSNLHLVRGFPSHGDQTSPVCRQLGTWCLGMFRPSGSCPWRTSRSPQSSGNSREGLVGLPWVYHVSPWVYLQKGRKFRWHHQTWNCLGRGWCQVFGWGTALEQGGSCPSSPFIICEWPKKGHQHACTNGIKWVI